MSNGKQITRYEVITQKEGDDILLPLPPKLLEELHWKEGDQIQFDIDAQGRYILSKV